MSKQSLSVAYILQTFPALTQTFIYREVLNLRERGFLIHTFSTRRPDPTDLSAETRPLMDNTFYIFPFSWFSLILVHLRYLFNHPLRYLSTLIFVLTRPGESLKNRWRTLFHFLLGMLTVREIERLKPDHLHSHFGWGSSSIALIASRMLGIPFSVNFHSFYSSSTSLGHLLIKDKIRSAHFVVAISEYHRQALKAVVAENNVENKIHVIHQGLDPQSFIPSSKVKKDDDNFTIVGVGQLIPCKGFHILIAACHHLVKRGVSFYCYILGEGRERSRLEKLIDQYNLHGRVFLPGQIYQEELRRFLNQADAFALPCIRDEESGLQDGLPVALTEAMAMELPVISTRISGIPELIDHGRNGLLVPPNDSVALADMLECLKNEPELRQQLGQAGRETVITEFNLHRSIEQLANLFMLSTASTSSSRS